MKLCDTRLLRMELEEYRLLQEKWVENSGWRSAVLQRKLQQTTDRLAGQLLEITSLIEQIKDPELRLIFELRYFRGYGWKQVASHLPTALSPDGARMKHDRYLKKIIPA